MPTTIDSLQIEIQDNSQKAVNGLDALTASLNRLKTATRGGAGLTTITNQLTKMNTAITGISSASTNKLHSLGTTLNYLSKIGKPNFSASTANQIQRLSEATRSLGNLSKLSELAIGMKSLSGVGKSNLGTVGNQISKMSVAIKELEALDFGKIKGLSEGLKPLESLGKTTNFRSVITQLKKLPETIEALKKADINTFTSQIKQLATSMKPLADEMAKVSAGFSAFPSRIQRLITQNERFTSSNQKVKNSIFGLSSAQAMFAKVSVGFLAVKRAANVMAGWVTDSNAYVENLNLFTVAMGKYTDEATAYARQVQNVLGINMSEWIRNQGIFMNMGKGFGLMAEDSAMVSKNLTQLGYDAASYFNANTEESMLKFQSGLAGELEPLRRWGFALDQATLQQLAYDKGIKANIETMTQAQKAQLRYIAIMEQSARMGIQNDLSRTLLTPANALRILNQRVAQLRIALGNMLIPILIQIVPYVQAFVQVLTDAAQAMAALFGFELPKIDYSGVSGLSSGADAAAGAMDDATKSAKELKNATLGFDELNVISPDTGSTGAGTGANGSGGLGLDLSKYDYDILGGLTEQTDKLKEKMKETLKVVLAIGAGLAAWKIASGIYTLFTTGLGGAILPGIVTWLGNMGRALLGIVQGSAAARSAFIFLGGTFALVTGTVALLVSRFVDLYQNSESFRVGLSRIGEIAKGAFDVITGLLSELGQWIASLIPEGIKAKITEFFSMFQGNWKDLGITALGVALLFFPGGQIIGGIILGFEALTVGIRWLGSMSQETWDNVKKSFNDGIESIKKGFTNAYETYLKPWFSTERWMSLADGARLGIVNKWNETMTWWQDSILTWWDENVAPWFTTEKWMTLTEDAKQGIVDKFTETLAWWQLSILGWWTNDVSPWFTIVRWATLFGGAKQGITDKWNETVAWWQSALQSWWSQHVEPWFSYSTWMNSIGGMKDSIIQTFKNAIEGARGLFNTFIDWLNSRMRFSWDAVVVAGKTLVEAGSIQLFTIPQIPPLFAEGGFPEQGQMFIAREAGAEMVGSIGGRTAVANNDQIVESVSQGVYEANRDQNALLKEQNALLSAILNKTGVYLDGKEITRTVEKVQRERGATILTGGVFVG